MATCTCFVSIGCGSSRRGQQQKQVRPSLLHFTATQVAKNRRLGVGDLVCPRHSQTSGELRRLGVYRHVNYRVEAVEVENEDGTRKYSESVPPSVDRSRVFVHLTPVDKLLPRFQRNWPVVVSLEEGKIFSFIDDLLITSSWYLEKSLLLLASALLLRNLFSIAYVPSESMRPTLLRGDAVLVEYVSSKVAPGICMRGEVVFFRPPEALESYVKSAGGPPLRPRDLFVKRVAACPGDRVHVGASGDVTVNDKQVRNRIVAQADAVPRRVESRDVDIGEGEVFVLGDNPSQSVDSRYWGPLPRSKIVARPVLRLWNVLNRVMQFDQLR